MLLPAIIGVIILVAGCYISTQQTPNNERRFMGLTGGRNAKVTEVVNKAEQQRDRRAADTLRYRASTIKASGREMAEDTTLEPNFRESVAGELLKSAEKMEDLAENLFPIAQVRAERGHGGEQRADSDDPFAPVRY